MFRMGAVAGLLALAGMLAAAADPQIGSMAPAFEAKDQEGRTVRLADFLGKSAVVLYFYPKDDTPGCAREACSLRDGYRAIQQAGAVVLGVSADGVDSHAAFARKFSLPFSILADPDGALIKAYGVKMPFLKMAHRVTFIIDRQGVVRFRVDKVDTDKHAQQVLDLLKTL